MRALSNLLQKITNPLTEISHMRALAELKDLDERKEHLRKEIRAAHLELMRLSGKEAMARHRLRMM